MIRNAPYLGINTAINKDFEVTAWLSIIFKAAFLTDKSNDIFLHSNAEVAGIGSELIVPVELEQIEIPPKKLLTVAALEG